MKSPNEFEQRSLLNTNFLIRVAQLATLFSLSFKSPPWSLKSCDFPLQKIKTYYFFLSLKIGVEIQYSVSALIHLTLIGKHGSSSEVSDSTEDGLFTSVILAEVIVGNITFNFFANVQHVQRCVLFCKVSKGDM